MDKAALRSRLQGIRDGLALGDAGVRLIRSFAETGLAANVVAGYWPIGSEIDSRPLMAALREKGAMVLLPRAQKNAAVMTFHLWGDAAPASRDGMGIPAPSADAEVLRPDLVLVPLLGFDKRGGRIGYGKGFYDRCFAQLRREGSVTAVGLAYAAQEVDEVPREAHDALLDWVITEEGVKARP